MSQCKINRLKKTGFVRCAKCQHNFNLDDVVTTPTSKRYCYECAVKMNPVTGKIVNDVSNDEFLLHITNYIDSIGKKLKINMQIRKLAILLVSVVIFNKQYVSKNKSGIACDAISLVCSIENPFILDGYLPSSKKILQMNTNSLHKKLTDTDIFTLSKFIHGLEFRN